MYVRISIPLYVSISYSVRFPIRIL